MSTTSREVIASSCNSRDMVYRIQQHDLDFVFAIFFPVCLIASPTATSTARPVLISEWDASGQSPSVLAESYSAVRLSSISSEFWRFWKGLIFAHFSCRPTCTFPGDEGESSENGNYEIPTIL